MMVSRALSSMVASVLALSAGCDFGTGFTGLGGSLDCTFDLGLRDPVRSDRGELRADVRCEKGADCADTRARAVRMDGSYRGPSA